MFQGDSHSVERRDRDDGLEVETELTRKQRDYLETVKLSAGELLGVINDIPDFSKIEAGRMDLEEILYDPCECLDVWPLSACLHS